mmetsp:Transcript_2333/g.2613  ORF Transcript_2333/g.2613 Transcript_2333/m.2613 type:complete len:372 (-) Transcript_2333:73-1188(-)
MEPTTELLPASDFDNDSASDSNELPRKKHWLSKRFSWVPTSQRELAIAEKAVLAGLKEPYKLTDVQVGPNIIHTLTMGSGPPMVLVHGFGGGVATWLSNLDDLSQHFTVYAIDVLGFARSSRPLYKGKTVEDAEDFFVQPLEDWRKAIGLEEKFYLMGHSLGSYICAVYSFRYPEKIERLVLADPWGVPKRPNDAGQGGSFGRRIIVKTFTKVFSPLALLRFAGPYGPGMVTKIRSDLVVKWDHLIPADVIGKYIFHCNAQTTGSGDGAFNELQIPIAWAKAPLCDRLVNRKDNVPLTFIYGVSSWMNPQATLDILSDLEGSVDFYALDGSHHVYADAWKSFNEVVISTCLRLPVPDDLDMLRAKIVRDDE